MEDAPKLYRNGVWVDATDAHAEMIAACEAAGGDSDKGLEALGFQIHARIGDTELGVTDPIALEIYKRISARPAFYVSIDGQDGSFPDEVYADTVIDLLDLLTRWGPGLQAAAVVARGPRHED